MNICRWAVGEAGKMLLALVMLLVIRAFTARVAAYFPARLRLTNWVGYIGIPAFIIFFSTWLMETFGPYAMVAVVAAMVWGVWDSRKLVKRWRAGSDPPVTGWYPFFGKPPPGVKSG